MKPKFKARFILEQAKLKKSVGELTRMANLQCGLLVERDAKKSMQKGGRVAGEKRGIPSEPGTPPHVQKGNLRASITTAASDSGSTVLVGPTRLAWYAKLHEFGGRLHPPRPFMGPALQRQLPNFKLVYRRFNLSQTPTGRRMRG